MDMRKLIGRNVRRIRLDKGLTQEQFAERSGFTQQYISGLERGKRNPTIVNVYWFAQALGTDHVALIAPDDEALQEEARSGKTRAKEHARKSAQSAQSAPARPKRAPKGA